MVNNKYNIFEKELDDNAIIYSSDEIDLRQLIGILWFERWLIASVVGFAAIVALIVSLFLTEVFRAEITLAPADVDQGSTGLMNQLGGAAAFLGVNVGSSAGDNISTALAILQSRQFIIQFIEKNDLLVSIFASHWDSEAREANVDQNKFDLKTGEWLLPNGKPTLQDAYREFSEILNVPGPDRTSGIVTISLDWHNPIESAEWLNQLISLLNMELKLRDVSEANNAIDYLKKQMESTPLVEMQQVFSQLIESQTRIAMLADVRDEYVFRVIDPALTPEKKYFPSITYFVFFGAFVGLLMSFIIIFVRRMFFYNKNYLPVKLEKSIDEN